MPSFLYTGDCVAVMRERVLDDTVDLVVTSPPYGVDCDYDLYKDSTSLTDYLFFLKNVFSELYRVVKPGGRVAVNVPDAVQQHGPVKPRVVFLGALVGELLIDVGFLPREHITWVKGKSPESFAGTSTAWGSWLSASCPYLRNFKESIFVVNKEWHKKPNPHKRPSTLTKEEFLQWTVNVWSFPPVIQRGKTSEPKTGHPCPFPEELPRRLIKLYSYEGDVVLDPFSGIGTTVKVAYELGRTGVGIELSKNYNEIARKRLLDTDSTSFY